MFKRLFNGAVHGTNLYISHYFSPLKSPQNVVKGLLSLSDFVTVAEGERCDAIIDILYICKYIRINDLRGWLHLQN